MRRVVLGFVCGAVFATGLVYADTFVERYVGAIYVILVQSYDPTTKDLSAPTIGARLSTLDANGVAINTRDVDIFSLLSGPEKVNCLQCLTAAKQRIKVAVAVDDPTTPTPTASRTPLPVRTPTPKVTP